LADLEAARLNTIKASGIAPNVALFGVNAAKVFIRNASVAQLLDNTRFSLATVAPIIQSNSVVRIGRVPGLELYEYAEYFEDDVGTIFPMLPDNFVMILSTETPNKIVYGGFTQLEDAKAQRFVTYNQSRIPFIYGDEEGGALFYRLTSRPLPMPADILGWRIIEALTLTFPAMVEGDAVLNELTGEITGGKEEADQLKAEAAEAAEKNKSRKARTWADQDVAPGEEGETETDDSDGNGGKLEEHTIEELRDIAEREDVDLAGKNVKADIIKAIKKARKQKG
jgi:hypothetical protein